MNIVFMGTPEFAKISLEGMIKENETGEKFGLKGKININLVVTNEDKQKGRGKKILPTPVKELANFNNIEVYQPKTLRNEEVVEKIKNINPDLIVVVAYGKIIPDNIISIPKKGIINVHGSLLPKYRGAAPIQWAVLNGDTKTGITIIDIESKLDAGAMLLKKEIEIKKEDTTASMFEKLAILGKDALLETIYNIENDKVKREIQDDKLATYAPMIEKEMGVIDFNKSCIEIQNKVRGMNGIFTAKAKLGENDYKIWKIDIVEKEIPELKNDDLNIGEYKIINQDLYVKVSDGYIKILEIQAPSKKKMDIKDFLRGIQNTNKL